MLNYDLFVGKIIKKYQKHIPENFSENNTSYVNDTTLHYLRICTEALNKDDEFDDGQKEYISEMVAKWVFLKSIEIIKDNVPQDKRDNILQNIAYTVFELSKDIITEQKPKGRMTGYVEVEVFKVYEQLLQDEGIINSSNAKDYKTRLDSFENYSKLSDDEWNKRNYNEAILNCEHALDIMPNHTGVLNQVACSYNELGNYEKALEFSDKAISLLVENTGGYIYDTRATALAGLKKYSEALADFDKAISIDNITPAFFLNKGKVLKETNDINAALECFNQAIELDTKYSDAYEQRGFLYLEQNNPKAAIANFKQVLNIEPDDNIKEKLANLYNETEDYKKSKKILKSLISDYPFDKNLYLLQARNDIGLNNLNEAVINLDNTISIDKNNAEAYYIRGLCNFDLGDYSASVADFNNAIKLDSDYSNYEDIKNCIKEAKTKMNKSKPYKRVYSDKSESAISFSFWQHIFIKYSDDGNVLYYPGFLSDGYVITSEEQIFNFRKSYNKIVVIALVILALCGKLHLYKIFKYFNINHLLVPILIALILFINYVFNKICTKSIFKNAIRVKEKFWVNNSQTMRFLKNRLLPFSCALVLAIGVFFCVLNFDFYTLALKSMVTSLSLGLIMVFLIWLGLMIVLRFRKDISNFCLTKEKSELNMVVQKELKNIENDNKSDANCVKLIENTKNVLPFIISLLAEAELDYITKVNNLKNIIGEIVKYSKTKPDVDLDKEEYRNELVYNVLSAYKIK